MTATGMYQKKFMDVLKLIHKLEPSPGFSHSLGTTIHHLSSAKNSIKVEDNGSTIRVELPITKALHLNHGDGDSHCTTNVVSLSTYLAIMDDITTYSLMTIDGGRPGVSISMNMEIAAADPRPPT